MWLQCIFGKYQPKPTYKLSHLKYEIEEDQSTCVWREEDDQ